MQEPISKGLQSKICKCPNIKIDIDDISTFALIDSGSEVTAISEEFYESNEKLKLCAKLPLNGKIVKGALGTRSTTIKYQILCPVKIGDKIEHMIFLIIPKLGKSCIFGYDTIKDLSIIIDTDKEVLHFRKFGLTFNLRQPQNFTNTRSCDSHLITIRCLETDSFSFYNEEYTHNDFLQPDNFSITKEEIRKSLEKITSLSDFDKKRLFDILWKNKQVFEKKPGLIKDYEYGLIVENDKPFFVKPYPIPLKHQEKVEQEIEIMLKNNIIRRSKSNFINPIVIAAKKDGSIRLCLDARELNKRLQSDLECPPGVEEIFKKCKNVKILTALDLTSSFWQINLAEPYRKYTAFMVNGRVYEFCVIPFGLKVSTPALLRALDLKLEDLTFILRFVDDMLCLSTDIEEHFAHLNTLLERLIECGITLNFSKCKFAQTEAKFLGHILTPEGIKQDPEKLDKIRNYQRPRNLKELQSFLGFLNFYSKFVDKYAEIAYPLFELNRKNIRFRWRDYHQEAFVLLIDKFIEEKTLAFPDMNKPYILRTDASGFAISAILSQLDDNGDEKIIVCISRTLKGPELNYFITEKEMLAIVWSLQKLYTYLLGAKTTVITDHKAITFFNKCRFANNRIMRWILATQDYDINLEYIKGSLNVAADVLSRNPDDLVSSRMNDEIFIGDLLAQNPDNTIQENLKNLNKFQCQDDKLNKIITELNLDIISEKLKKVYEMKNDILMKNTNKGKRIVLPEIIGRQLVMQLHTIYGHIGHKKVYKMIDEDFTMRGLKRKTHLWLKNCDICQRVKYKNTITKAPLQSIIIEKPNQLLSIDFIGPLPTARAGMKYILVCLDAFSKYVALYPLKNATTDAVINKIFNDYVLKHGKPERIQADHGTQFTSKKWIEKLKKENIVCSFSSIRHPQAAIVERCNKEIKRFFRTFISIKDNNKHGAWIIYVKIIEKIINEIHHETTELTPIELHKGIKPERFWQKYFSLQNEQKSREKLLFLAKERIANKRYSRNSKINSTRKLLEFSVGDLVLLKSAPISSSVDNTIACFFDIYEGPYTITKKFGITSYMLKYIDSEKERGMFHVNDLKPYIA